MADNSRSSVEYETNVTVFEMEALTDSGDATIFNSQASLFSEADGYSPDIKPNGVLTGLVGKPAVSGTNDKVDVSAGTVNLAGVETIVAAATDVTITRPATNVSKVIAVTVTSAGAVAAVAGTDGATTAFSTTPGAAGGPPFIPVGSVLLFHVRLVSSVAAPITAAQIFSTITGTAPQREKADYPGYETVNENGTVGLLKGVFASYAAPLFLEQKSANDFVPVETSTSISSTAVYNGVVGSKSKSIQQGSFTAILKDGITDDILTRKDQNLWFRYKQDRLKAAHILTQGTLSVGRTFGASDNPKVKCTISADKASVDRAS